MKEVQKEREKKEKYREESTLVGDNKYLK